MILLLIVALIASSLITVQAYSIDSLAKPSAPELTVRIVAHPYDVPPKTTTTIDQYTGKETTTTQPGYHVENKSIEITIKNPQFTPINVTEYTPASHYWYEITFLLPSTAITPLIYTTIYESKVILEMNGHPLGVLLTHHNLTLN